MPSATEFLRVGRQHHHAPFEFVSRQMRRIDRFQRFFDHLRFRAVIAFLHGNVNLDVL